MVINEESIDRFNDLFVSILAANVELKTCAANELSFSENNWDMYIMYIY